ncbi:hypothetical protein M427DRAFT_33274 [Gonapodya prolifera JEL478]|uniref:Pentacotripeptide-repeat region of PRORP domain-containing protein n=1 Tax=Gonapodya prolifera (strain JEL478) TaxID=1344416 RepID=A0A139ABZ4_GONPJ|nr:hypothetical protein M427DRAFT_33274 [Gonapodya prolifera JEL478]|eukprot:KXS14352.1 hypothetical protein M427DRAFT_33274 [Gonapodya prolifera JEL478]
MSTAVASACARAVTQSKGARSFSAASAGGSDSLEDLRTAVKARNLWEVNRIYDHLASNSSNLRSFTPDDIGAILSLHLKSAVPERVTKLLEDVSAAGVRPALGEFNTYVRKNARAAGWVYDDAVVFLDAMRKRGVKPDSETYQLLISALIGARDAWGAKKLMDQEQPADEVPPTPEIYTSLIRGLAEQGDVDAAKEVVDDMLDNNVRPDSKLLQETVEDLMKRGFNDAAFDLVNELAVGEGGEAVVEMGSGGSRP